jgi:hypothetical protein
MVRRKTGHSRGLLCLLAGLGAGLFAPGAAASPIYPGELQDALDLGCAPPCTVCHQTIEGGYGTIRPGSFGAAMLSQGGLVAGDPERLRCALSLLAPECEETPACADPGRTCADVDSDGDGTNDVQELRDLTDPNNESGDTFCGPRYGCGARIAGRAGSCRDDPAAAHLVALLVALGLVRRRMSAHRAYDKRR